MSVSPARLEALLADITTLDVDAVVNAANEAMLGGGGVDGAIHRAAGPGLLEECRQVPMIDEWTRCPRGEARITGGHRLKARFVIHTVGPVWRGGAEGEEDVLASCYRSCITLAGERGLASIAFPCIATGVYGFPSALAAEIAVRTVRGAVSERSIRRVVFAAYSDGDLACYQRHL